MATSTDDPLLIAVLLAASGAGALIFLAIARLVSRPGQIREARRRVQALLLELWLFGDEPAPLLHTQWELIRANARYASLLVPTMIACAPPLIALWFLLDPLLGKMPVPPGSTVIVTAPLGPALPRLGVPAGFHVETPPARIPEDGTVSWRVRAEREAEGELRVEGTPAAQMIVASRYPRHLGLRLRGVVEYSERRIRIFGLEWPWEAWFALLSTLLALSLHRRFGVAF